MRALEIFYIQKQPLEVFCKKGVLKNFAKLTGKYLCQSFFFNKVADPTLATLLKKRLWNRYFSVSFAKFSRTLFLRNTSGRLFCTSRQNLKLNKYDSPSPYNEGSPKNFIQNQVNYCLILREIASFFILHFIWQNSSFTNTSQTDITT